MRIAVIGAGGLGGYYGGLIAKNTGHEVFFVARGEHLKRLQEEGLTVISPHGSFHIPVRAVQSPEEIGKVDFILYTVKTYSDHEARELLQPLLGEETVLLSLQNGVEKEKRLSAWVGSKHVIGGLTYIEASIQKPGVIDQKSMKREVIIGEMDGQITDRLRRIEEVFRQATIPVRVTTEIMREIWKKYIFISSFSAITTATGRPIGPIRENPVTMDLLKRLIHEGVLVARAHEIPLTEEEEQGILQVALSFEPGTKSSMQKDAEAGKPIEVEDLSGTLYRLGKEKGVDTPVHQTLYGVLTLRRGEITDPRIPLTGGDR